MKKILFFLFVVVSLPAFSARYLVQLGSGGAATWTNPGASGGTLVDLTVAAKDFDSWYNEATLVAGDEVWIAAGTYLVNATTNLKDGVNVYGSFAGTETAVAGRAKDGNNPWDFAGKTIIDGGQADIVAFITATTFAVPTVFDGLSVTNFYIVGAALNYGFMRAIGTLTVQNCILSGNKYSNPGTAGTYYGGLYIQTGVSVLNSWLHHNSSPINGTINTNGAAISMAGRVTVKGCTFEYNSSTGFGGGISILSNGAANSGGGTVENCIFRYNVARNGGGIFYSLSWTGELEPAADVVDLFKNNQFFGNRALAHGGGMGFASGTSNARYFIAIEGCTFASDTAGTGKGAGIFAQGASPTTFNYIKNCTFRDNVNLVATADGAAIQLTRPTTISNCVFANNKGVSVVNVDIEDVSVVNNTFANNAAIALRSSLAKTGLVAKNNIFWFNTNNAITGAVDPMLENNAYNNVADAGSGSIATLTAENTFVAPTSSVGPLSPFESEAANWALKAGSPAIDAGVTIDGITNDILGKVRPHGSGYDIGAYEYGASSPTGFVAKNVSKSKVYPSVTNGIINIESEESLKRIRLFDLTGKMISEWAPVNQINIETSRPGIYVLQLTNFNGNISNYKIYKQ